MDFQEWWRNFEDKVNQNISNTNIIYRGQADKEWKLESTFARSNLNDLKQLVKDFEYSLAREGVFPFEKEVDIYEWLKYGRHYGLPTPYIDFSYSPYVSLFFACSEELDKDGMLYMLNIDKLAEIYEEEIYKKNIKEPIDELMIDLDKIIKQQLKQLSLIVKIPNNIEIKNIEAILQKKENKLKYENIDVNDIISTIEQVKSIDKAIIEDLKEINLTHLLESIDIKSKFILGINIRKYLFKIINQKLEKFYSLRNYKDYISIFKSIEKSIQSIYEAFHKIEVALYVQDDMFFVPNVDSYNKRMMKQNGCFLYSTLKEPIDDFISKNSKDLEVLTTLDIPKEFKKDILKKLFLMNISGISLYGNEEGAVIDAKLGINNFTLNDSKIKL